MMCVPPLIRNISLDLYNRDWHILKTGIIGQRFITSDNPVLLWRKDGDGNVGVLTKDVKIFFPLTPYVTLMLDSASIKGVDYEIVSDETIKKINELQNRNALRYVINVHGFEPANKRSSINSKKSKFI